MTDRLPPRPPSREEVDGRFGDLIAGRISREEASAWASQWVTAAIPGIEDEAVWDAVSDLYRADGASTDRPYLFDRVDFEAWLATFRDKIKNSP